MAVIPRIATPTSWEDNLDWDNPKPYDVRYWMAINEALEERHAFVGQSYTPFPCMPGHPMSSDVADEILEKLGTVSARYVHTELTAKCARSLYENRKVPDPDQLIYDVSFPGVDPELPSMSGSVSPIYWSLDRLNTVLDGRLLRVPVRGMIWMPDIDSDVSSVRWMRAVKDAIDLLRCTTPTARNVVSMLMPAWTTSTGYDGFSASGYTSYSDAIAYIDERRAAREADVGLPYFVSDDEWGNTVGLNVHVDSAGSTVLVLYGSALRTVRVRVESTGDDYSYEYTTEGHRVISVPDYGQVDIDDVESLARAEETLGSIEEVSYYDIGYSADCIEFRSVRFPPMYGGSSCKVVVSLFAWNPQEHIPTRTFYGDMWQGSVEPGFNEAVVEFTVDIPKSGSVELSPSRFGGAPDYTSLVPSAPDGTTKVYRQCTYQPIMWVDWSVEGGFKFRSKEEETT